MDHITWASKDSCLLVSFSVTHTVHSIRHHCAHVLLRINRSTLYSHTHTYYIYVVRTVNWKLLYNSRQLAWCMIWWSVRMIVHVLSSAAQLAPSISTKCNACNKSCIPTGHALYCTCTYVRMYVQSSLLSLQEHCTTYRYSTCLIQSSLPCLPEEYY